MADYVISDTHFGHKNIIQYCERPFENLDQMHTELVRRWNDTVRPNDIVYHLGDVSFGGRTFTTEWCGQLNGRIVLVVGNHDRGKEPWFEALGWKVTDLHRIKWYGKSIILTHYPFESFREDYHFHGHTHGKVNKKAGRLDVGVDSMVQWNYRPIFLQDAMSVSNTLDEQLKLERGQY